MTPLVFLTTFLGLTFIVALRYFAVAGLFHYLLLGKNGPKISARHLAKSRPKDSAMAQEIRWSIISSFIYAFPATLVIAIWQDGGTQLYTNMGDFGWAYIPVSVLIVLFLHDTYFYWTHRWMHLPRLFAVMHKVHHASRPTSPWAAFSFHPTESIIGAIFLPLLVFFVPLHIGALLFILTLMTVCAVLNHSGYELMRDSWLKGFIGKHLITAAHHNLHHENYAVNFALYFRFWDRVMNTDLFEEAYDFASPAGDIQLAQSERDA